VPRQKDSTPDDEENLRSIGLSDDSHAWRLIERVVAGDASPADRAALDSWIGGDETRQAVVSRLVAAVGSMRRNEPRYDARAGWEAIAPRLATRRPASRMAQPSVAARIAACGVVAALGLAWWIARHASTEQLQASRPAMVAQRGQRVSVRLADGSQVTLAPQSRLTPDPAFGKSNRAVALEGRAYFNVVHDASRPFTVTAAGVRIRDVGTAFEVDAYAAKDRTAHATPRTQVVVVSGSVLFEATHSEPPARLHEDGSVSAPPASAIVTAGQLARLDDQAHTTLIEHVDVADWLSWTTGDLVFRDVPLQDAVVELERWYDVDIVVADSALARRHITATFHDETLPQVLRSLALVLHARFERSDHSVTLRSAPQPTARAGGT